MGEIVHHSLKALSKSLVFRKIAAVFWKNKLRLTSHSQAYKMLNTHTHTCRVAKLQHRPHIGHHHVGEAVQQLQRDDSPNCPFPPGGRLCRMAAPKAPGTPTGRTTPPRRSRAKPRSTASRREIAMCFTVPWLKEG